ncbi:unnamed protein product [marine sediment metagenome]|uniref:Uncharacterized protein n=1 Tax=marine sediment metagenome TaxID=412755 RepID=X1PZK5_9ZZZZ
MTVPTREFAAKRLKEYTKPCLYSERKIIKIIIKTNQLNQWKAVRKLRKGVRIKRTSFNLIPFTKRIKIRIAG